jgi:hypothetical protein
MANPGWWSTQDYKPFGSRMINFTDSFLAEGI